jgi:phosphohistidine swiveling domain-containing protein
MSDVGGLLPPAIVPVDSANVALRGSAASCGCARGTARILHRSEDGAVLPPGDILVCADASVAWVPALSFVAGIVTETGAPLSSLATVARERGVPVVVGIEDATTLIGNGRLIQIDGAAGIVSLME